MADRHLSTSTSLALVMAGAIVSSLVPFAGLASTRVGHELTASGSAATDNWTQAGYGPGQSSFNNKEVTIGPASVAGLQAAWRVADPVAPCQAACAGSAAAVVHGVVYQSTGYGVFARRASNGHLLWHAPLGTDASGTGRRQARIFPAVGGGLVFVGFGFQNRSTGPSGVVALNAANGQTVWTLQSPNRQPPERLVLAKDVLYADIGPALDAIDPKTGQVMWSRTGPLSGPLSGRSVEAVADGRVYAATFSGLVALSATTGKTLWGFVPHPNVRFASFAVAVKRLVYVGFTNRLYELDQRTGQVRATVQVCRCVLVGAAVANGVVYTTARTHFLSTWYVEAVSASSRTVLWRLVVRTTGRLGVSDVDISTPVVANGVSYLEEFDAHARRTIVQAVDAGTGKMLWHRRLPIKTMTSLTVAEGKLFASLTTGMIAFARQ